MKEGRRTGPNLKNSLLDPLPSVRKEVWPLGTGIVDRSVTLTKGDALHSAREAWNRAI